MRKLLIVLLTLLLTFLSGCNAKNVGNGSEKKTVTVSIAPEATFVRRICGDKFDIVTAIPAGASPETYEPSPKEIKKIADSCLYFSIGVPAEENSILPIISDKTRIIELHKKAASVYPDLTENGARDPHIWLSIKRVIVMTEAIAEVLQEIDPENAEFYSLNAKNFIDELKKLDEDINATFKNLKTQKFITFHSAFGYFADDYSLTQCAIEEHGKETTAKRFAEMADLAKKENIKTIFYQAEGSKKQALSFAEEIGGKAVMLEPLSPDYTENLKSMTKALSEAMK